MRGNGWTRGADEFDALISGGAGDADQYSDLLELVASLRATPPVSARPDFVASLRTQLIAAAERAPAQAQSDLAVRLTPRQRRGSRERRLAALVGGFAVVSATGSMAMAAQDALPGDVLYPVKRAIENAQTNLQRDGASKSDTLIAHAEARLDEVQELAARDAGADVISATLQDFTDQSEQASEFALDDYAATGKTAPIAELRAFAADSMDILGALGPIVPDSTRSILITATQTVRQIDSAAWEACPSCADNDIAEVPDFALQSLNKVLNGPITDAASVTKPVPNDKPTKAAPSDGPSNTPSPSAGPSGKPSSTPGAPNLGPLDDLTKDILDPITGTPSGTDKGLAGTVVDGVTGILGGLGALLK
ncbi:DUF5667 domain-containing protein [Nocardioides sp. Root190]|uniref:DUF5667 domain-containing protein n=1 Tax=Nocardioides sp. Root190 TaxID=1736488 RepID=UPI000AF6517A|nr:DUF5667 domain-containing protein [Nocardioides sp. Root190]